MKRLALLALLFACGKDATGDAAPGVTSLATVTLTDSGPQPDWLEILADGQVTFTNRDSVAHQLTSSDCADLPFRRLEPGASQTFAAQHGPRTCTYGDALGAKWTGTLHIVERPRQDGGAGY